MKKLLIIITVLALFWVPLIAIAGEGPMKLPAGSNKSADMHNNAGISNWNDKNYEGALGHFQEASQADSSIAETHFNEAVTLDKLGRHGKATMHFKAAKKYAKGNDKILKSPILNGHIN